MKFTCYSTPEENATIEFSQKGNRTLITIREIVRNEGNDGNAERVTHVSVPTKDLLVVAQVFS